jgi:peptide/nickel transport system permease protein
MYRYIIRRLLMMIPVILLVTVAIFLIVRVMPGDIADLIASDPRVEQGFMEDLRGQLGLDRPIYVQFFNWLGKVLMGDLGKSMWTGQPCAGEIGRALPVTFEIAFLAVSISAILAVIVGVICAIRQDTAIDYFLRMLSIICLSAPGFWISLLLITFGALWFKWAPPLGFRSPFEDPFVNLQQVLPAAVVLGILLFAVVARMLRSSMLEVVREDYIRTAWAKGLGERVVVLGHALRNAIIPTLTVLGNQLGVLLGGSVIIETIFALPGFGQLIYKSISVRDYTLIQASVLTMAVMLVILNLLVDILYAYLDPRIRYE